MSLESNLELNNQLVARQNELQERNIALLERLVQSLASGVALKADTVAQVQEYRETVTESKTALTLDDLRFGDVIALAAFYPVPQKITEEMLQRAVAYRDATAEARVVQIDALDSALQGVKRATELHNPALIDLSRHVLKFWDELPTIGQRRDFAELVLDTPPGERAEVKPKKTSSKEKKERKGPFFVRHDDGKIGELSTESELKTHLDAGYTEINKVEFLQLQEEAEKAKPEGDTPDFDALRKQAEEHIKTLCKGGYRAEAVGLLESFGAKKLGEVEDKDLASLVASAEKTLEG
ncbi:hypothetical protein ORL60_04755 [Klebsiella michiganensis]|uniref:hypothetical protein n=1 Tax=Klebsiella michiganensis TaxID=1134687 RepID=UPI0022459307|nr:hypothetical protein [Klebsiella michiganensis]MCW9668579.1 hypothetical protein [Klebsiella michiganensis]